MVARMVEQYPFFLAGEWRAAGTRVRILSPYNGEVVGETWAATELDVERAIQAAANAFQEMRRLTSHQRWSSLQRITDGIVRAREELARGIVEEAGKPLRDARAEVDRAVLTFQTAAEEAKRVGGETLPLDLVAGTTASTGIVRRVPLGPVLGITPFNFPLNLVALSVAPALAAGCSIVIKPAPQTPLTSIRLARIISEAGLPAGAVSVLPVEPALYDRLVTDERFRVVSFTGSAAVGWSIKAKAARKRVLLELGGNAGVIIDQGSDVARTAARVAAGGFTYAGQSCISVQRTYVHRTIEGPFTEALAERARGLRLGDPMDPDTDLGPMINEASVARTAEWVREAVEAGARVVCGGNARGRMFEPTVLTNVDPQSKVCRQEVFAPVVGIYPFIGFKEAVAAVNDSEYGLQAGIFTDSLEHVLYAFDELQVGGIIVNETPTWRMDTMPYGGSKASGEGREGVRYAIEEMTEPRLLAIHRPR